MRRAVRDKNDANFKEEETNKVVSIRQAAEDKEDVSSNLSVKAVGGRRHRFIGVCRREKGCHILHVTEVRHVEDWVIVSLTTIIIGVEDKNKNKT